MDQIIAQSIADAFTQKRLPSLLGYDKRFHAPPAMPVFPLELFDRRLELSLNNLCTIKPTKFIQNWSNDDTRHFDSMDDFMARWSQEAVIVRRDQAPVWYLVDRFKHLLDLEKYNNLVFWDGEVVIASIKTGQDQDQSLWLTPGCVQSIILNTYHDLWRDARARGLSEYVFQRVIESRASMQGSKLDLAWLGALTLVFVGGMATMYGLNYLRSRV